MNKEGFYRIEFQGVAGYGVGVLVLETGIVVGGDIGGVSYDGTYRFNPKTELLDMNLTLSVPPLTDLVVGVPRRSQASTLSVSTSIPRDFKGSQVFDAHTDQGLVKFTITKIRDFPD